MKPIIGLVGRPQKTDTESSAVICFEEYRNAVIKCGRNSYFNITYTTR